MIIDAVCLICIILFMIRGYRKGLVVALFSVLAIVLGALGTLKLSGTISGMLFDGGSKGGRWAPFLTYLLVFIGIVWLVKAGAALIQRSFEAVSLGWANRLTGAVLYLFLISFVLSCLLWLFNRMDMIRPETMAASYAYPLLAPLAPRVCTLLGTFLPFVRHIFDDLGRFFDTINQHLPSHVGPDR